MSAVACAYVPVAADPPEPTLCARAQELARDLGLPYARLADLARGTLVLACTSRRLELREAGHRGAVFVDFVRGPAAHRARTSAASQPLGRALGLGRRARPSEAPSRESASSEPSVEQAPGPPASSNEAPAPEASASREDKGSVASAKEPPPSVLDATAGLGRDAWALACLGCRVTGAERHPALAALLQDGRARAAAHPRTREVAQERLAVLRADAREALGAGVDAAGERFEVVYLDPMYPQAARGRALARREMRMLRALTGGDPDARELLDAALAARCPRVVVKRPAGAAPLAPGGAFSARGKLVRYDVYLPRPEDAGA